MRVATTVFTLAVSLAIAGNLWAAEEQKRPQRERSFGSMMIERLEAIKGLNLSDDQKAKLEAIKAEYAPKFKAARQKADDVLTAEQKKTRSEAIKAAEAAGKKGIEVRREVQTATKLTDDQKAKMAEARKEMAALGKEVREKVLVLLTPEQKEQVKKAREEMRDQRPMRGPMRGETRGPMGRSGGGMLRGLNLTDDQQQKVKKVWEEYGPKLKEARDRSQTLRKEVREKVLALLTPEQKEQVKKDREQRREHHPPTE